MKQFFKQCLDDLEALTGLRQLYFMEIDLENGKRRIDTCLEGMILAARDYPYIPEEAQKKIIREQMVKDQTYEALNSRIVHKWLTASSSKYFRESGHIPEGKSGEAAAPPEVADKYAAQLLATLAGTGKHVPQLTPEQAAIEGKERRDPYLRGPRASGYKPDPKRVEQFDRLAKAIKARGLHAVNHGDLKQYTVDKQVIVARNEEEAQEIYLEVYSEEIQERESVNQNQQSNDIHHTQIVPSQDGQEYGASDSGRVPAGAAVQQDGGQGA